MKILSVVAVLSVCCLLAGCGGRLVKKDSEENSIVAMKIEVSSPLYHNSGDFGLYNVDTSNIYTNIYISGLYCFVANVPKGRYIIKSLDYAFSTGSMHVDFAKDNSGVIRRKIYYNNQFGLIGAVVSIAAESANSNINTTYTTNDIVNTVEIKEAGDNFLDRLNL